MTLFGIVVTDVLLFWGSVAAAVLICAHCYLLNTVGRYSFKVASDQIRSDRLLRNLVGLLTSAWVQVAYWAVFLLMCVPAWIDLTALGHSSQKVALTLAAMCLFPFLAVVVFFLTTAFVNWFAFRVKKITLP